MFTTMTVVGTPMMMQEEEARLKDGTLIIKVLSNQDIIEDAKITLTNREAQKIEFWTSDDLGYGRPLPRNYRSEIGITYDRPAGSYELLVEKESFVPKKITFFLPEAGYIEKIILLHLLKSKKKKIQHKVDSWTSKATMPTSRIAHTAHAVKNSIYVTGGWKGSYYNKVEAFNTVTNRWSLKSPMLQKRDHHAGVVHNNQIYIFGGHNKILFKGIPEVDRYDPIEDKWETLTKIPTVRHSLTAEVVQGKFYVIGGQGGLQRVEMYDPKTNIWTRKSPMPTPRYHHQSSVVKGKIYVLGGRNRTGPLSNVEVYDPETDTWTERSPLPAGRYMHTTQVYQGKIYLLAGKGGIRPVLEYNPQKDSWLFKSLMPTERYNLAASIVRDKIYLIGGNGGFNETSAYSPRRDTLASPTPISTELEQKEEDKSFENITND